MLALAFVLVTVQILLGSILLIVPAAAGMAGGPERDRASSATWDRALDLDPASAAKAR